MTRLLITMEYPPDVGGVAEYYRGLVDAMPRGSVRVLTPRDCRFFVRWLWPHWLPLLWNAWCVIRREKPDEVWVGQILPVGTVLWILKKLHVTRDALRVTLFTHGMDILVPQRSAWKRWLMRQIFTSADRIISNTEFTKCEIMKSGIAEKKIRVVYPCPNREVELQNPVSEVQLPKVNNKKVLLTVARLVKRKGIDLVVGVVARVKDQFPDLVYVIVGDGPEKENLQFLISNLQAPAVLVGAVSEDEKRAWLELCDIFIMTPRQIKGDVEGFGIVYLEAGLHGKPVIGSRTGGVTEAVIDGETGLLVPENDVSAIAESITRLLLNQPLAQRLGEQGKHRVHNEFVWSKQIQKLAS